VLFVIEPESYRLKWEQAQAAEVGSRASVSQTEAEYKRQSDLGSKDYAAKSTVESSLASRDQARSNLSQAEVNTKLAKINYDYTQVAAPMDGVATSHLVSIGELVGVSGPTQLGSVVQLDPIYVNFAVNEQDVQRLRAAFRQTGKSDVAFREQVRSLAVEIGLQTETGYPHRGAIDYAAPTVNQSTGTHDVRAVVKNSDRAFLPGNFVRVRVPAGETDQALLVPDVALGTDLAGRYLLVVNPDDTVEQRKVEAGAAVGGLRVIEAGLKAGERVVVNGLMRAVPGQKVAPQLQTIAAAE